MSFRTSLVGWSALGMVVAGGFWGCAAEEPWEGRDALEDDEWLQAERFLGDDGVEDLTGLRNEQLGEWAALSGAEIEEPSTDEGPAAPSASVGSETGALADPQSGMVEPLSGCGIPGTQNYCTTSETCRCEQGEGDCDTDDECAEGFQCAVDVGASYDFHPLTDVCVAVDECSHTIAGRADFCSESCPCAHGEGDCDNDNQCVDGTLCAQDVGKSYGFGPLADVCITEDGCSHTIPGRATFCSSSCKCDVGEGDCDSNEECLAGLICGQDIGANYGFGSLVDVCVVPPNWVLDLPNNNSHAVTAGADFQCLTGDFTAEAYVHFPADYSGWADQVIVARTGTGVELSIEGDDDWGAFDVRCLRATGTPGQYQGFGVYLDPYYFANKWNHVACTYAATGSVIAIYVNGVLRSASYSTTVNYATPPGGDLFVGYPASYGGTNYDAFQVEELRLSSLVRYTSNFTPIGRTGRFDPSAPGTCRLWHFDEAQGSTTFLDAVGSLALTGANGAATAAAD